MFLFIKIGRELIMENPDITSDELQEKMALWEANLNIPNRTMDQIPKPSDIRY